MEVIPETYAVIINGSYATTSGAGDYAKGTIVNINAGSRSGYNFNGWTSTDGITLANANSASTSFTMPNKPVILMANWKSTSTNSGGGSGGVVEVQLQLRVKSQKRAIKHPLIILLQIILL